MRIKTPSSDLLNLIPQTYSVLDLGCGNGQPFVSANFKLLIGIDAWKIFDLPEYDLIMKYDIRGISNLCPPNSFDAITAIDIIEHLEKEEGYKLIEDIERIAKKMVLIFTPTIWSQNTESTDNPVCWSYGNKDYNLHKSLWTEKDFIKLGYGILPCQEGYVLAGKKL